MIEAAPFSNSALAIRSPRYSFATIENVLRQSCDIGSESRRLTQRYSLDEAVTVQPLDENFQPSGFEMTGLTRDIGHTGIGLTMVQPVKSPYLRVTFDSCRGEQNHSIVIKVRHQTQQGATYVIGGNLEIDWCQLKRSDIVTWRVDSPMYRLALMMNIRPLIGK